MASLIRYEALARTMLDARSDVRSLTPLELLRLDYKEFNLLSAVMSNEAPSPARTIGVAAITLTLRELLALAGGAAGLEAAMAEAMCASNSAGAADVLFVITAAEGSSVGRKHLLALAAPTAEADARHGALLRAVASASSWLPERLATQPLFVAQAVVSSGARSRARPMARGFATRRCARPSRARPSSPSSSTRARTSCEIRHGAAHGGSHDGTRTREKFVL